MYNYTKTTLQHIELLIKDIESGIVDGGLVGILPRLYAMKESEISENSFAQRAYESLNTLIDYAYTKESDILPPIIHTNDLMNRLKPFVEIMRNELEGKVLKNPLYAHIGMEECYSCGHKSMYGYKPYCEGCGKKNIMNAGGKIYYSLLQ